MALKPTIFYGCLPSSGMARIFSPLFSTHFPQVLFTQKDMNGILIASTEKRDIQKEGEVISDHDMSDGNLIQRPKVGHSKLVNTFSTGTCSFHQVFVGRSIIL